MKICLSCGLQYEDERKFCRNCGKPLVPAGPSPGTANAGQDVTAAAHCSQCGSEVAAGAKFCASCGAALTDNGSRHHADGDAADGGVSEEAASVKPEPSTQTVGQSGDLSEQGGVPESRSADGPAATATRPPVPRTSRFPAIDQKVVAAVVLTALMAIAIFALYHSPKKTGEPPAMAQPQETAAVPEAAVPAPGTTESPPAVAQALPPRPQPSPSQPRPAPAIRPAVPTSVPEPAPTAIVPQSEEPPAQAPPPEQIIKPAASTAPPVPEAEPAPSPPPTVPAPVVPADLRNERVEVKLLQSLAASTSRKGDRFRTEVVSPANLRGAVIEGEITAAKAAGKVSGRSELAFSFDTLAVNSTTLPIRADLLELRNSQGDPQVDEEGHVIGKSSKARDAVRTGIMAGVGAALGGIFGGKKGAAQGAAIGAAVGLTVTFSTRGEDIKLAPGSVMELEVSTRSGNQKN